VDDAQQLLHAAAASLGIEGFEENEDKDDDEKVSRKHKSMLGKKEEPSGPIVPGLLRVTVYKIDGFKKGLTSKNISPYVVLLLQGPEGTDTQKSSWKENVRNRQKSCFSVSRCSCQQLTDRNVCRPAAKT
jgi:hypothetical protein